MRNYITLILFILLFCFVVFVDQKREINFEMNETKIKALDNKTFKKTKLKTKKIEEITSKLGKKKLKN